MNHMKLLSLATALALAAPLLPAEDIKEVTWNQVCRETNGHELQLTTAKGETVSGYCVGVTVDEISIRTGDAKVVKVARTALARLEMHRAEAHQVASLHRGVHRTLADGFKILFSPMAPVGTVVVPGTLAWGAVALPFCALGDLHAKLAGKQTIKPI